LHRSLNHAERAKKLAEELHGVRIRLILSLGNVTGHILGSDDLVSTLTNYSVRTSQLQEPPMRND